MSKDERLGLTDRDRKYLARMMTSPGYGVLKKLIEGFVLTLKDGAEALSQRDPLRNKELIVDAWAYYSIAKRFEDALDDAVQFELSQLQKSNEPAKSPDEVRTDIINRRRADALGELDVTSED